MNISQRVICNLYEDFGEETITSQRKLFDRILSTVKISTESRGFQLDNVRGIEVSKSRCRFISYKVFYKTTDKSIDMYEEDLKDIDTPLEFNLNFLAHIIEATTSNEKTMSAASYKIVPLPHQIIALDRVINQFRQTVVP